MKISNLNRIYAETESINTAVPSDSESKDVLNQISNAQKQLKELSGDPQLDEEEKEKKRKEIQRQITELNKQLKQHQLELRREQEEKKKELSLSEEERKPAEEESRMEGMSHHGVKAIISSHSAINQAREQGKLSSSMEGRVRVLQSEINQDERYGINTERKQEELKKLVQRSVKVKGAKMSYLSKASRELKEAAEKDRQTQTDKNFKKSSGNVNSSYSAVSFHSVAARKTDIYIKGNMFSNVDFHF